MPSCTTFNQWFNDVGPLHSNPLYDAIALPRSYATPPASAGPGG